MTAANEFKITKDGELFVELVDGQYRLHSNSRSELFDSIDELIESLPENLQAEARSLYEIWNNI